MRAPSEVKTYEQLLALRRDNFDADNFWIMVDSDKITIAAQKLGEKPTAIIDIPRSTFNKLIRWYTRQQKPLK